MDGRVDDYGSAFECLFRQLEKAAGLEKGNRNVDLAELQTKRCVRFRNGEAVNSWINCPPYTTTPRGTVGGVRAGRRR